VLLKHASNRRKSARRYRIVGLCSPNGTGPSADDLPEHGIIFLGFCPTFSAFDYLIIIGEHLANRASDDTGEKRCRC